MIVSSKKNGSQNGVADVAVRTEFASAVTRWAEADADFVADFMRQFHVRHGTPLGSWQPPAAFLSALAIAVRLHEWERTKFRAFRNANLPNGKAMVLQFIDVFKRDRDEADRMLSDLQRRLRDIHIESIAWGQADGAVGDVELVGMEEDQLLDAIARIVWSSRSH